MFPVYVADNHHEDQTVCAIYLSSVRKPCPCKYLTTLQCTQLKARSEMKILKNKDMIMSFFRRAVTYLEGWKFSVEVTDVKTKDMVLCSLNWAVARRRGANARTWSYTWMMSSRGKQNICLHCCVTHPESCVKSPRSYSMVSSHHHTAEQWHSHVSTVAANICQQMNYLH